jgi:hypothetical protein
MGVLAFIGRWTGLAPENLVLRVAAAALLAALGFAAGNYVATQRAVAQATKAAADAVLDHSAREMAAATAALIAHQDEMQKKIVADAKVGRAADDAAHARLTAARDRARADAAAARALLDKAMETNRALENSQLAMLDTLLPASGSPPAPAVARACGFTGATRRLLDHAAGVHAADRGAGTGIAEADAAGGSSAGAATGPGAAASSKTADRHGIGAAIEFGGDPEGDPDWLSCSELLEGYLNLAEHGRADLRAPLEALQQWVRERLLPSP